MRIVIEVPDGAYEEICEARFPVQDAYRLVAWIMNGTPLPEQQAKMGWIPVTYHEVTDEEREENGYEDYVEAMYDCELPDDGQDVLIQTRWGMSVETFSNDIEYGCAWGDYDEGVLAWMPLPEPYKGVEHENRSDRC